MKIKNNPVILIISGPSGAGKSTLSHALVSHIPDTTIVVSTTTRNPRLGERDGKDYFFISKQAFQNQIDSGAMLEYAEVYGHLYGTSRSSIKKALVENNIVILDIDWQGAKCIKEIYPDAISVFILPPAGEEAKKRLFSRQQDSGDTILQRMSAYEEQISHQDEFDHILTNIDINTTTQQLHDILAGI